MLSHGVTRSSSRRFTEKKESEKIRPIRIISVPFIFITILFFSCENSGNKKNSDSTGSFVTVADTVPTKRVPIDSSGYTIALPISHFIQAEKKGDSSTVYYFTPHDTVRNPGEGGFYIGTSPQAQPPDEQYTARELHTSFLGKDRTWIEYTTADYIQRETFIDMGNNIYIHAWCYSNTPEELERLFTMINSIRK